MLYLVTFLISLSALASPFIQSIAKQEIIQHGKKAYTIRCAGCHGLEGDGQGPAAMFLEPKPRDFTAGIFKFRSGPLGSLPSDQDLMQTISKGIPHSSMPSFVDVPEQERFAMVQYIKTFSPVWVGRENYTPAVFGSDYPQEDFENSQKFLSRAKKGRKMFIESCVLCHGNTGEGDGEGAIDLADDWENRIKPANLTKLSLKTGKSVKEIYKTLLVGVNGTPMSSYKDVYTDDELWDLTAWVLYLRGVYNGVYDKNNPPINMIQASEIN